jgi:excisionase family DNA binding protein
MAATSRQEIAPLLSVAEVGLVLGVSASTVRRLIDRGELAGIAVGRQVRIAPGDLEEMLGANQIAAERRRSGADAHRLAAAGAGTPARHAALNEQEG